MNIPERHDIYRVFQKEKRALSLATLTALFKLNHEQAKGFCNRLEAMARDGQLISRGAKDSYLIGDSARRLTGVLVVSGANTSMRLDSASEDHLKIPARLARGLVGGDRLAAYVLGENLGKDCLVVSIKLLERDREIVGVVKAAGYIEPLRGIGPRYVHPLGTSSLKNPKALTVDEGNVVIVRLRKPDFHTENVSGEIIEVLGDCEEASREVEIVLRIYNISSRWDREALAEADRCKALSLCSSSRYQDLRDMDFVTIDGKDAKDFDDAVFFEKTNEGWCLWVAIADVSSYVKPGSALDEAAKQRGNSVYFPGHVVPMLPPVLSDDLCSLRPKEERMAMVCRIELSSSGEILRYEFMRAVILSQARLTYSQVGRFLEGRESLDTCSVQVRKMLGEGLHVFKALLKQRKARGALDLDLPETRMLFDKKGQIRKILPFERNNAHRLIEECMICANICAAKFLGNNKQGLLHRTHAGFKPDAFDALKFFLRERGVSLRGKSNHEIAMLLEEIAGREDSRIIQIMLLRSLTRAVYQPQDPGHYGLALDHYTHFTSPIRRYSDLLVHRAIGAVIDPDSTSSRSYSTNELKRIGEHCSMTERCADDATRDIDKYLKCLFIQDRKGESFDATVIGVTDFGLFLELQQVPVEGLLHIGSLGADYFHFDNRRHQLVGKSSGRVYRLGDHVRVVLSRVLPEERKVDFVLPGVSSTGKRPRRKVSSR